MNRSVAGNALLKQNRFTRFLAERRRTIVEIIAALFILLFVYTAMSKLFDYENFKTTIGASALLRGSAATIAWMVPAIELLVSCMLLIPKTRKSGLYSSFILMAGFTLYVGWLLAFADDLPCSCGGVIQQMTWSQHLLFNIFFTAIAWIGVRLHKK